MIVYECNRCKSEIKNRNESVQDGLNCPSCRYPLNAIRQEKENKKVVHASYKCLCCAHSDKVYGERDEYLEVRVCPECNGAFVDVWFLHKHHQVNDKIPKVISTTEIEINRQLDENLKEIDKIKSIQVKLDLLEKVARISSLLK